jgi:hypothetical protein
LLALGFFALADPLGAIARSIPKQTVWERKGRWSRWFKFKQPTKITGKDRNAVSTHFQKAADSNLAAWAALIYNLLILGQLNLIVDISEAISVGSMRTRGSYRKANKDAHSNPAELLFACAVAVHLVLQWSWSC